MSISVMDIFTVIPAVGAAIIAVRNWLVLRKGADITPHKILSYGIVRDQPDEPEVNNIYIPLIFHNDGTKGGMITKIEIVFQDGETIKKLPIISKIKLNELSNDQVNLGRQSVDMVKFEESGYTIQIPMFPISVPAGESAEAMFQCYDDKEDNIIPLDKELKCIVKIEYGRNKTSHVKFPFMLTSEDYDGTDLLRWFRPEAGNMREQFPGDYD